MLNRMTAAALAKAAEVGGCDAPAVVSARAWTPHAEQHGGPEQTIQLKALAVEELESEKGQKN